MDLLLKEIGLEGFKSFRDRTTFKFDGLVTAVVGPNGSGKSNVVDAIKWVLGDPSPRSVRASSGVEAIFRPPEGNGGDPAGFCAISLKIDNSEAENDDDPSEWEIERRYYRSGDSGYSINGRTARLKDVRALMARKGFGLGSLSVVAQGEIDGFLSLVPADRRLVFEDLAGISDFKANKRKILNRLEDCARNHDRLRDLIGEISVREEELKVQAADARRHAELSEAQQEAEAQLAAQEYLLALRNVERNDNRLEELREALSSAREQEEARVRELESSRRTVGEARKESAETLAECEEGRRELERAAAEERRLTEASGHLSTLLRTLKEGLKESEQRIDKIKLRQAELEEIARNADHERSDADRRRMELDLYLSRRWGYMRACERERERMQGRVERLAGEGSLFARDAEFHTRRAEALGREIEDLNRKKLQILEEIDMREVRGVELKQECERLESAKTDAEAALDSIREKIAVSREKRAELEERQRKLTAEIAGLERENALLAELEASREGYGEGVKAILERRDDFPGLRGTLGELIQVQTGREQVIESVLGDALEFLVVDTLAQAINIVDLARSDNLGPVTCVVLELIPESFVPDTENDLIAACSVLPDILPVLSLLLRGAREIPDLGQASLDELSGMLVASDGTMFRPPAFLSGGSKPSATEGILTRRGRLNELGTLVPKKRADAESIASEIADLTAEIKRLEEDRESAGASLEEKAGSLRENETELRGNKETLDRAADELSALEPRLEEMQVERNGYLENAGLASSGVEAVKRARIDAENDLERLEKELPALGSQVEDLRARLQRAIVEEASYREEGERTRAEVSRLSDEISSAIEETFERKTRLDEVREEIESASDELRTAAKQRVQLEKVLPEFEKREREASKRIENLVAAVSDAEIAFEEAREEVRQLDSDLHGQEVRLAELRGGLSALERGLDQFPEFAGRVRAGEMSGRDIPSKKELGQKLESIVEGLGELGDVNPLAIEEEQAASRRLEELRREREDLVTAEEDLRKALEEIERESERAFTDTFKAAKEQFANVFESLFPGGSGELKLTDPGNPLESGIDVRVRFPGKGELDLLQLSGGERALIALALLFAILKVKPSSFTILDEVEASLDDINTEKFLDYLTGEFPDRQFVLITHNKITMERADRLYGVTMRESGVSQVVSVDLKRLQEEGIDTVLGPPN